MIRRTFDITRRQVLLGAGGASLALPILPSLLGKTAFGAEPAFTRAPRLFWLTTDHGGAFESNMFPARSMADKTAALFPDHMASYGTLQATATAGDSVLSEVLRAPAAKLTPALIAKMNVLWGFDVPFYISHNTGLHLGNYARNDGNGGDGLAVQSSPRPTIDQILAFSSTFYPDTTNIRERAMVMSTRPISWNYSDPAAKAGTIESVRGVEGSRELFDRVFGTQMAQGTSRPPIVDRVLESYQRLRNGNQRLSTADKQRLDDHMARIAELQRKLTTNVSCTNLQKATEDSRDSRGNSAAEAAKYCQLFNDVVVAAFTCGASRIGVFGLGDTSHFAAYGGDWHQEIAHQWQLPTPQQTLVDSYQKVFEFSLLDLASKLDIEEVPGTTYLDNSLLAWTQECGMETHGSISIPVVTFGGAAGYFKTGQLVDFRRFNNPGSAFDPGAGGMQYMGLLYSQWLATVLQAMGLPPAEFERWGHKGYGVPFITLEGWTPRFAQHYADTSSRYFTGASDRLPIITA